MQRTWLLVLVIVSPGLLSVACGSAPAAPATPSAAAGTSVSEVTGTAVARPGTPMMQGAIASLAGTCPALTFALGDVTVRTTGDTAFEGGRCGALATGTLVAVEGARQGDRVLQAGRVLTLPARAQRPVPAPRPSPAPPKTVAISGSIAGLGGACPSLTFTLGGAAVATNAATVFEGKACAAVATGDRAGVDGTRQGNRSLLAVRVKTASPR